MDKLVLLLEGLDCPNCAEKIEKRVGEMSGVRSASLDFINKKMTVHCVDPAVDILLQIENCVHKLEPDVRIVDLNGEKLETLTLRLNGLDCPQCAEKIGVRVGELGGVSSAAVSFVNKTLTVRTDGSNPALRKEIEDCVHKLEPDVEISDGSSPADDSAEVKDHRSGLPQG